jgi:Fe-S-cluster-containing dehydrogenase component
MAIINNKSPEKDRRKFIKTAGFITGGIVLTSALKPFKIMVFAAKEPEGEGPWYGIGIDIEKCIGCGNCASSCKQENDVPEEPFYFRSWVEKYTIMENEEVIVQAPNGGIDGFFVPKMCNHCHKSPCVQVCPVGATFDSPDGVVLVDQEYCIGCRYCIQACPYGCRYIHPEKKVVDKCTLCYHRIVKGLPPACMDVCPTGARIFGDLRDKKGDLHKFIKKHNCHVLKSHLNTGSKLYYNGLNQEVR